MEKTSNRTAGNDLREPLGATATARSTATPEQIYAVLADLRSHAEWGGGKKGLRSIEAPAGPAHVGTEFSSVGNDPMGEFEDRSVVTEARPGELFEFVTEAVLRLKKGDLVHWTLVHRYAISRTERGSSVTYSYEVTRISGLTGMLRLFNVPVLGGLLRKASASVGRRGLRNLIAHVEKR